MAKEIKVIKCPSCGSTSKTEIKPDFFQCTNCQTTYFLDDNDVNVNYNHNYKYDTSNNPFAPKPINRTVKIIAIVIGVFFGLSFIINIIVSIFTNRNQQAPIQASVISSSVDDAEPTGYRASRYNFMPFTAADENRPVVLGVEERDYNRKGEKEKDGVYVVFYDPVKKSIISDTKIGSERTSSSNLKFKTFSNGNIYMIADKTTLYAVDKTNFKLVEAGKQFFSGRQELQVGVATMEFVYEDNGDGMVILTNDGKQLYYFPLVQKLYTEDAYYEAQWGFDNLLPGSKEKDYHVFTKTSDDYPNDKLQLLNIRYKDNGKGPKNIETRPSWGKDYGGSGIFTERDPYKKVLFDKSSKLRSRIISWKDVTPGRLYFSPKVIFDDGKTLLITFKPDANPRSTYNLQQVNVNTGAAEWTLPSPKGAEITGMVKYALGYVAVTSNEDIIMLDFKGNQKSIYNFESKD